MMPVMKGLLDSVDTTALKRAGKRAGFHMLRASLETVKAVQAVVEELRAESPESPAPRQRIEVE